MVVMRSFKIAAAAAKDIFEPTEGISEILCNFLI